MTSREEFTELYKSCIHRDGADKLLEFLCGSSSDFFTAPASTKFHLSREGGLCEHSIHVFKRLRKLYEAEYGDCSDSKLETLAIVGLLHDLCKVNFYKLGYRNVKDENGKWQSVASYSIEDTLAYGHGEGSVYVISAFMKLTREEALAIRWHMGGFDDSVRGGSRVLSAAMDKCKLITFVHVADMMASYLDECEAE